VVWWAAMAGWRRSSSQQHVAQSCPMPARTLTCSVCHYDDQRRHPHLTKHKFFLVLLSVASPSAIAMPVVIVRHRNAYPGVERVGAEPALAWSNPARPLIPDGTQLTALPLPYEE